MGCINSQIRLIRTLDAWERAERIAGMFSDPGLLADVSDKLFMELTEVVFACGFEPGGFHRNLSIHEFAQARAATIARVFPNHVKEAR